MRTRTLLTMKRSLPLCSKIIKRVRSSKLPLFFIIFIPKLSRYARTLQPLKHNTYNSPRACRADHHHPSLIIPGYLFSFVIPEYIIFHYFYCHCRTLYFLCHHRALFFIVIPGLLFLLSSPGFFFLLSSPGLTRESRSTI